ncbi:GNAT family N-acetyltransferase [Thermoflavimicrobium dichotomicum]|uniref:Acetyltransferase (GNAT) family protein n=1 Tax=Thermoflavimicrobium dichotomicum TaxID=46223 RepID=A0A1I3NYS8_9BACL|nr:GNAT family N-acetyltransferase [Thermoflavimicrobium dichotomicum]SFJ14468.1 Acetyltransferase (GNAT) family protein [Thermoflavimicrobium dichotomicum]
MDIVNTGDWYETSYFDRSTNRFKDHSSNYEKPFRNIDMFSLPPSALEETVDSIFNALHSQKEQAALGYIKDRAVAMVRFRWQDHGLYFYRLSVLPAWQGKGIAKSLLLWLENLAQQNGKAYCYCRVRKMVERNIRLYTSLGYQVLHEEIIKGIQVVTMKKQVL